MKLRPTRAVDILVTAVVSAVLVWVLLKFAYSHLPPIPRTAPISLTVVAALALSTGSSIRARLLREPGAKPITALQLARVAALAKALTSAGAVVIGGWVGLLVFVLPTLERGADRSDAITALIGLVPSIAILAGGLWLERLCKAPPSPPADDEDPS